MKAGPRRTHRRRLLSWRNYLVLILRFVRWRGDRWGLGVVHSRGMTCSRCGSGFLPGGFAYIPLVLVSDPDAVPRDHRDLRRLCLRCAHLLPHVGETGLEYRPGSK